MNKKSNINNESLSHKMYEALQKLNPQMSNYGSTIIINK